MARYLIRGVPEPERQEELEEQVRRRGFLHLRPFGNALSLGLENARLGPGEAWLWEEEDYCSPPLKQERAAVFDRYFAQLEVLERVEEGEGRARIEGLPRVFPNA